MGENLPEKETKDILGERKKTWRVGFTEISVRTFFIRRIDNRDET